MTIQNDTRKIYIDVLRILSAMMVLYIHSGAFHFWENNALDNATRIMYMVPGTIVDSANSIFMMITGSLLLRKDDGLVKIVKQRIPRVLIIILVVTTWFTIKDIIGGNAFYLYNYVLDFVNLNERRTVIYWFLYWWLSFTVLLPITQKLVKVLDKRIFNYIFILFIIFSIVLPFINIILQIFEIQTLKLSSNYSLFILGYGIFYPLLGYYIDNVSEKKIINIMPIAIVITTCVVSEIALSFALSEAPDKFKPVTCFTPIITVSIYLFIKMLFVNFNTEKYKPVTKTLIFFGSTAIGVYIFQGLLPNVWTNFIKGSLAPYFNIYIIKVINLITTYIILSCFTGILRLIKPIRKVL